MRYFGNVLIVVACATTCVFSDAQESPSPAEEQSPISPDKKWEYRCSEYGFGNCYPEIVKAGTADRAVDLDQELPVSGGESSDAEVMWAPDSKRFAFNYSPLHAHHTTYKTVAFYQLRGDKWVALRNPQDYFLRRRPDRLPKGFNPRQCVREWDEVKLRTWTDANTAILYVPCYDRSRDLKAAFLFTLKFDGAGNWKIIKTRQMSTKELEEER
jgi:hypothetical protein